MASNRSHSRRRILALWFILPVVVTVAVVGASTLRLHEPQSALAFPTDPTIRTRECLNRPPHQVTVLPTPARSTEPYRVTEVPDDHTFDARRLTVTPESPNQTYLLNIGKYPDRAVHTCLVGGTVVGTQDRDIPWRQMKRRYDGAGLRIDGKDWYVVDGLRVDNAMDGVRTTQDHQETRSAFFRLSNTYLTDVHDDCLEDDSIIGGLVFDSLFDGCFMGFSQRGRGKDGPQDTTLGLDGVLVRIQGFPFEESDLPAPGSIVAGRGHGQIWKWSTASTKLFVRNSVFVVPGMSVNGASAMDWPGAPGGRYEASPAEYENVTLVWLGAGEYPGKLPASGVTVTRDRSIWPKARQSWLSRHGCTSFDACNMARLIDPDPI